MNKGNDQGQTAENLGVQAVKLLMQEWDEVVSYHHSKKSGEIDTILHTDIVILLRSRLTFLLQIKSSWKGAKKHIRLYPHIMVITIRPNDSPEKIARKIKQLILRCYKRVMGQELI